MKQRSTRPIHTKLSALGQRTAAPPISWLMSEALKRPNLISLAAGFTDNQSLPVSATRKLLNGILDNSPNSRSALQYGTGSGNEKLRLLTARHLAKLDRARRPASYLSEDDLIITNGSQQFLYLLTEVLCDPGDIILVEDPTYFVYLSIMQSHGIEARTIPMTNDGLSLEGLENTLDQLARSGDIGRVKLLYSVTYFQNPTGITTTLEKKRKALELLQRYEKKAGHRLYYVEDAAYRELSFPNYQAPVSALTLNRHRDRIIYTSTFSKPFATGIRVGYGTVPSSLRDPILYVKGNHDFGTAHLLQTILASALEDKEYQRHLERIKGAYATKCDAMLRALQQSFPDTAHWTIPNGGLCLWATLPQKVPTGPRTKLFRSSLDAGVLYVPGEFAYAPDPTRKKPNTAMRLSFGSANKKQIQQGIARLGDCIRRRSK